MSKKVACHACDRWCDVSAVFVSEIQVMREQCGGCGCIFWQEPSTHLKALLKHPEGVKVIQSDEMERKLQEKLCQMNQSNQNPQNPKQ